MTETKKELTEMELVRAARREYARKYRAKNKEKIKGYNEKYWLKKAKEMK